MIPTAPDDVDAADDDADGGEDDADDDDDDDDDDSDIEDGVEAVLDRRWNRRRRRAEYHVMRPTVGQCRAERSQ